MRIDSVTPALPIASLTFRLVMTGFLRKIQSDVRALERHINRDIHSVSERLATIEGMPQV